MSFTKVSVAGIGTTGTITLTNVSVAGVITATDATFTGNVSVAGTITYEDVTNVDSVGLITARSGIDITGGGGLNLTGGAGVVTATTYRVGTASTLDASGLSVSAGVVTTTTLRVAAGSAAAPSITPTDDTNTGIFFPSADTIAFGEGGSEAARIDSSGRLGIGTSSPSYKLEVAVATNDPTTGSPAAGSFVQAIGGTTTVGNGPSFSLSNTSGAKETFWRMSAVTTSGNNGDLVFNGYNGGANYPERLRITAAGNVGIGTTIPQSILHLAGSSPQLILDPGSGSTDPVSINSWRTNAPIVFKPGDAERIRIDGSGRLLVGTSTARSNFYNDTNSAYIQLESASNDGSALALIQNFNANTLGGQLILAKSNATSVGSNTLVASGDSVGRVSFQGNDGTQFVETATIRGEIDGTPGANDMPGRLVFSTTADGASSPTERMRISANGSISACTTSGAVFTIGTVYNSAIGVNTNNKLQLLTTGANVNNDYVANIYAGAGDGVQPSNSALRVSAQHWTGSAYVLREVFIASNNGSALFPQLGTTASAANAFLDSGADNRLLRSTSSLRYKTDIENIEENRSASIINLRPVWYRSLAEADRSDWSWYGLIAEEVAEIEPRLVHWTYLEDAYEEVDGEKQLKPDAEMVPDGVQYDRLAVLLLDVVKRQQQAIETLEARLTAAGIE